MELSSHSGTEAKREKCINGGYARCSQSIWGKKFAKGGFDGENANKPSKESTSRIRQTFKRSLNPYQGKKNQNILPKDIFLGICTSKEGNLYKMSNINVVQSC